MNAGGNDELQLSDFISNTVSFFVPFVLPKKNINCVLVIVMEVCTCHLCQ